MDVVNIVKLRSLKEKLMATCDFNGKVYLPPLIEPPEPLLTYVTGTTKESKRFPQHVRKYNSCL